MERGEYSLKIMKNTKKYVCSKKMTNKGGYLWIVTQKNLSNSEDKNLPKL